MTDKTPVQQPGAPPSFWKTRAGVQIGAGLIPIGTLLVLTFASHLIPVVGALRFLGFVASLIYAVIRWRSAPAPVERTSASAAGGSSVSATGGLRSGTAASAQRSATKKAASSGASPSSTALKVLGVSAFVASYAVGGVLAAAAVIGGSILKTKMPPLVEACNVASAFGDTRSVSHGVLCGVYSFAKAVAPFLEYGGIAVLLIGGVTFLIGMGFLPKVWKEL